MGTMPSSERPLLISAHCVCLRHVIASMHRLRRPVGCSTSGWTLRSLVPALANHECQHWVGSASSWLSDALVQAGSVAGRWWPPANDRRRRRLSRRRDRRSSSKVDRSFAEKTATGRYGSKAGLRSPRLKDRFTTETRRSGSPADVDPIASADTRHRDACRRRFVAASAVNRGVETTHIGAAVVTTFMVGGSSVGVCDFPATQASIMSAHSCSM